MIFEEIEKRTGKKFIVASRYWPDGTRFRRRYRNKTLAKRLLDRIEGAIAMGTWPELKRELTEPVPEQEEEITIREFADTYFQEYCYVSLTVLTQRTLRRNGHRSRVAWAQQHSDDRTVREVCWQSCLESRHRAAAIRGS
jgi:hypothetical protein